MKAIAITPGKGDVRIIDIEEPRINAPDEVKLKVLEVGICGTDREEVNGGRADAPEGENTLVIGHEMLGEVTETGSDVRNLKKGDLAIFMVRRPCNHCEPCHNDRSDICNTGNYTERGIKGRHGFQTEYVVDKMQFLVPVPAEIRDIAVLTEPMSVVEKAIDESLTLQAARIPGTDICRWFKGKRTLVAGIGPIGLLAAFALRLREATVYGLDIVDDKTPRPSILREIGGEYINGKDIAATDIDEKFGNMNFILEATGIAKLEFQLMDALGQNGVYVLTGIPSGERPVSIMGADLMRDMVLMNQLMLGSVNAGILHYRKAVDDLVKINKAWPETIRKLISSKVSMNKFREVLTEHSPEEIKTVIKWA